MNHRRRILHLIGRLDGYGGARMLRRLAAAQALGGEQVIVAALTAADDAAHELRQLGVAVHGLGSRWPVDPLAHARLARLQRTVRPAVVHAWDVAVLSSAALPGRTPAQPLLLTIGASQTSRRWSAPIVRMLRHRVSAFAAADVQTNAWLQAQGVVPRFITVIPPGVPRAAPAHGSRQAWRTALAFPGDAQVIAIAGPLIRRRQVDDAVWCFELVRVLHERPRLAILGDGPDRPRLESFAQQVSEPGCVRFLGYRGDAAELFSYVDAYWQLEASATTPLALLEAAAAGAPIVASDTPAHRGVIVPDRTGWLAPPGQRAETARATDELLRNPDRAQRLGAAGAELIAQRWSLDAALAAYERLYEHALLSPSA